MPLIYVEKDAEDTFFHGTTTVLFNSTTTTQLEQHKCLTDIIPLVLPLGNTLTF